jgi:acetyl esterase/lipase
MHPSMPELLEGMVIKQPHSTNPQSYIDASPVSHVCADAPPFVVLHGRNDSLVPAEQARSFVATLRAVSTQPIVDAELPFTQHAFDMLGSVRAAHAAIAVEQFLAEIYRTQRRAVIRQGNASTTRRAVSTTDRRIRVWE